MSRNCIEAWFLSNFQAVSQGAPCAIGVHTPGELRSYSSHDKIGAEMLKYMEMDEQ
jgi:hypothetical protein